MPQERILMGVIGRPHGVRGLVHVHSYTADPEALPSYGVLDDDRGRRFRLKWKSEGIAELFQIIEGKRTPITTREAAQSLVNTRLYIPRTKLPPVEEDEFYLADLIGLEAIDGQGRALGRITTVHDYGAGTSLEIGALIVPFTRACVPVVDIEGGKVTVLPPAEVIVAEPRESKGSEPRAEAAE
jgi:16S rRNA processing protein RimM